MSFTLTPNHNLKKIDFDTEENTWGDILNQNFDTIDSNLGGGIITANPIGSIFAWHKTFGQKSTGSNDSFSTNKLINSSATFISSGVQVNMIVHNETDNTWSHITAIDSETSLSLANDIFTTTGKAYKIYATSKLPVGYEECNGQLIIDPASFYNGQTLPDLNGQANPWNSSGSFLRGDTISGVVENDSFQGHNHEVNRYSWNAGGSDVYYNTGGSNVTVNSTFVAKTNGKAEDPLSDGTNGTPRIASETRPVNMSVVWIMRIK